MKKIVSLLVVLAMLLSVAPAVFAEGDFGGESYQELVMGENVAVYTAETDTAREQAAYFTWTAEADGVLTIDFSDDDEATVWCSINHFRNDVPIDEMYIEEHGGVLSVEVLAGDVLTLQVEEYNYQDATLHFTASFTSGAPEDGMAGSGTDADPWILTDLSAPITGTFTSEADGDHYYLFVATEAGTISWGPWSGCALFITLNGAFVDSDFVDVQAGDEFLLNAWALYGIGDYSVTLTFEASAAEGGGEGGEGGEGDEGGEDVEGLILGDNTFQVPGMGSFSDVFVAPVNGTLIITVTEMVVYDPDSGDYVEVSPATQLSRMGYYDLIVNDEETNSHVYTLEVVAGETVTICIAAMSDGAMATVNLTMEAAEGGEAGNDTPASGTVDVTVDTPIIFELVLESDDTVTIDLTSTSGWEVHIGNATGDVDSRYWSDSDGAPIVEALPAGTYTITIYGYDEETWFYTDATITYSITVGVEETTEVGDVNGDGKINARDARELLRWVAGLIDTEIDETIADYNNDGKVNARDARALLRKIAGLE